MTIDERLDRLTVRHEALTETVELLVHSQQEAFAKYDAMLTRHDEVLVKHEALLGRVIALAENLTHLAQSHERRISDIEGGRA
jgi:hypothetical protein